MGILLGGAEVVVGSLLNTACHMNMVFLRSSKSAAYPMCILGAVALFLTNYSTNMLLPSSVCESEITTGDRYWMLCVHNYRAAARLQASLLPAANCLRMS
jgi:hypothetical protein